MALLNENVRDKILHATETSVGSRAYKAANNGWRSVVGLLAAEKRAQRIADLGRSSLDGVEHQERNLGWVTPDRFEKFPTAPMGRHRMLHRLHEVLRPRAYLEIGIDNGASLSRVSVPAIGIDPEPVITYDLGDHIKVFREKSDDFFARPDATDHLAGTPLDLAFVDGMHLAEFALRDFMNLEKAMPRGGVIVFDDMLPRNDLEAFRVRRTNAWAGDVYKVLEVLRDHRPDLVVLPLNTNPTGTALVTNLDPTNRVLDEAYEELEEYCTIPDPQRVAPTWKRRLTAIDPRELLASSAFDLIRQARTGPDADVTLDRAASVLRALTAMG